MAFFACSSDLEVQERSSSAIALLDCLQQNPEMAKELTKAYIGELNPVAPKAQRKVIYFDLFSYLKAMHFDFKKCIMILI